ncbi:hypothetical protein HDC92_004345 [Pedobacter sp. AK017]|uniref:hypothetical protein n=1 Tax=Pedobacter sp. AK017 TaxID=2723073 RepID=UPI00161D9953|nr:hypothetical protein [Pedobacter sp. AK017]MBB5440642.1 hypothetical protein [Pedobacter sp. AK017]
MKRLFSTFVLFLTWASQVHAQIYVDPAVAAATAAHSGVINNQLGRTNENLTLIQRAQLAVTGELAIANDLQNQIYRGLSEVSGAVRSLLAVKDIAEISADIARDATKAVTLAQANPVLLLFAEQGAREFKSRALALAAEVSSFALQGGINGLMDSGERAKILDKIRTDLMILRGVAYGMHRTMFWTKQRGILNSLNPYSGFINIDKQIADDILLNSKLFKR